MHQRGYRYQNEKSDHEQSRWAIQSNLVEKRIKTPLLLEILIQQLCTTVKYLVSSKYSFEKGSCCDVLQVS